MSLDRLNTEFDLIKNIGKHMVIIDDLYWLLLISLDSIYIKESINRTYNFWS